MSKQSTTNYVADFLERRFPYSSIQITEECCKKCLRGHSSTKYSLEDTTFKTLMEEGKMEPHQVANAFHAGSAFHAACLKNIIINVKAEGKPCKYPGNCELSCIVCHSLIERDGVELPDYWPGFKAHKKCVIPCQYPGCKSFFPTLPVYMRPDPHETLCSMHAKTAKSAYKYSAKAPMIRVAVIKPTNVTPVQPMAPPPPKIPQVHKIYQEPKPTRLPQPPPEPRIVVEPSQPIKVKRTFSFKKPAKAKADKFDEHGKSKSIIGFFHSGGKTNHTNHTNPSNPSNPTKSTNEELKQAVMQSAREEPPRRFLRNKETGDVFGYWKGNTAYHIETDLPLFEPKLVSTNVKFDYTPPICLSNPAPTSALKPSLNA